MASRKQAPDDQYSEQETQRRTDPMGGIQHASQAGSGTSNRRGSALGNRRFATTLQPCASRHICIDGRPRGGLSQTALAKRSGMDRSYVSGLEAGQRNPTAVTLQRLAKVLGVTAVAFFQ